MKKTLEIVLVSLLVLVTNCGTPTQTKHDASHEAIELADKSKVIEVAEPRLIYVIYGSFCGECSTNCTRMYKHYLIGNTTTFRTDKTDSYFSKTGLTFDTALIREAETIGFELVNSLPNAILENKKALNIIGCPDCDDGCGLYLEFQLEGSEAVIYKMEYSLGGTSGEIKALGEQIIRTINKLEQYR